MRRAEASAESAVVARTLDSIVARTMAEVDLWGASLSDMQVSVVLDAVCANSGSIRTVDLGRNTVGEEALRSLEHLLAAGDIKELKLSGNGIGDAALARIASAMPRTNEGLELLSLEANCLTDAGIEHLCHVLVSDGCRSLTSLNLANNKLTAPAA